MDEVRPFPKSYAAAQARLRILERCLRKEQPLAAVAWEAGISVTTLARWLSQYRRDGLEGLMRRPRQFSAPPAMKPEIRTAIEELAGRQPAVRVRPLYRQVRQMASRLGEPDPGYWAVREIVHGVRTAESGLPSPSSPAGQRPSALRAGFPAGEQPLPAPGGKRR
jgi:transposase-like protein